MVKRVADGEVEFEVYLPDAESVEIVGDFNRWEQPGVSMVVDWRGWWRARVRLAEGDHLFSYLVDGSRWLPDYAASGIERNRYGGWVSQLRIEFGAGDAATAA